MTRVALSCQGIEDSKRIHVLVSVLLLSDVRQQLCAHRICRQEDVLLSPLDSDSHMHTNVSVEETVQLLHEVTNMLMVLASSGWHQLMVFYFQVIPLQWKRSTFLSPDGIWVEKIEQNDSKKVQWNEKSPLNKKKRGKTMTHKLPPTLYIFRGKS